MLGVISKVIASVKQFILCRRIIVHQIILAIYYQTLIPNSYNNLKDTELRLSCGGAAKLSSVGNCHWRVLNRANPTKFLPRTHKLVCLYITSLSLFATSKLNPVNFLATARRASIVSSSSSSRILKISSLEEPNPKRLTLRIITVLKLLPSLLYL